MKPSTHALRVLLGAFKDRGMLTADELESVRAAADCAQFTWTHRVRPDLRRAGVLRQSRANGNVVWLINNDAIQPRARLLRDRYLREQRVVCGEPPPPPPPAWQTKFRDGSRKYLHACLAYERYVDLHNADKHGEPARNTETPEQEARRLEQVACVQRWEAENNKSAPRWTGPNIHDLNQRCGDREGSLGVPR